MDAGEISGIVRRMAAEIYELDAEALGPDEDRELDALGDSIQRAELIAAVEKRFNIDVGPSQEEKVRSLGDLVRLVETHAGG